MSQLNIRGLDEATSRAFKSQAAARGMVLSEYLAYVTALDTRVTIVTSDGDNERNR